MSKTMSDPFEFGNKALVRVVRGDARYRFVIDINSLKM